MRRLNPLFAFVVFIVFLLTATAVCAEQVSLTFTAMGNATQSAMAEALIQAFESDNPDISVTFVPAKGKYPDYITTAFVTGQAPDVFIVWGSLGRNLAESGALKDLTSFIERDLTENDIKDYIPAMWSGAKLYEGPRTGIHFGIPAKANMLVTYFNADALNEAGLNLLSKLKPGEWNWDLLRAYARKLTKTNDNGVVTHYGFESIIQESRYAQWVWAAGGQVFDYPENPSHFVLDNPTALRGLEFIQELRFNDRVMPVKNYSHYLTSLNVAIADEGISPILTQFDAKLTNKIQWDIAPLVAGPTGKAGNWVSNDLFAMSNTSKHPEEAWRFLKFISSVQGMRVMLKQTGIFPARISVMGEFRNLLPTKNWVAAFDAAVQARIDPYSTIRSAGEVSAIIKQALDRALTQNELPVVNAISEVADAVRAAVSKM